ncbi:DUF2284 domain-containing protein [candidate division KSB1 bacterium]|nr:DUF2284 domain-containing protein [candidate division KSB1 bacterium]
MNQSEIEKIIAQFPFKEYQWITPDDIVIAQWVRLKCLYGCGETGRPACPPNLPSIESCRELIREYKTILMFHFQKEVKYGEYSKKWAKDLTRNMLDLEKKIFLSGYYKTFLLNTSSCNLCKECKAENKTSCKHLDLLRPCPEAVGIDVFGTVRKLNYPIEVLREDSSVMNRYAFILVE